MQTMFAIFRKTSGPALTVVLFSVTFALGFVVFSMSGSVVISAVCMGIGSVASALAARELAGGPDDDQIKSVLRDETQQTARLLGQLAERVGEIERDLQHSMKERNTPDRLRFDALNRDIERISSILSDLVFIVDAQDQQPEPKPVQRERPAILPISDTAPKSLLSPEPAKPQAPSQIDTILRDDILNGKVKVRLADVTQIETGRVALRQLACTLQGRTPDYRSDQDLIDGNVASDIVRLFDRVRFGYAFEFATQFGMQHGTAPILCPLMGATFSHSGAADEIVGIIESDDRAVKNLVLEFDYDTVLRPALPEDRRLHRLASAGASLAVRLGGNLEIEPEILFDRGVKYALVDAELFLGRTLPHAKSAIHPSDLASFLGRFDIALIVRHVDTVFDAKAIKTMGVVYASGAAMSANGLVLPAASGAGKTTAERAKQALADPPPSRTDEKNSAPLRDMLRRVRL